MRCLVAGAGGFIGGFLVKRLLDQGHEVQAVDIKNSRDWWQYHEASLRRSLVDLRYRDTCQCVCQDMDRVYNLACNMGGIGFIENHHADCMDSVTINANLLYAAEKAGVERYFYSSSACVYRADKQDSEVPLPLREEDVGPPYWPEQGYGLEKLFSERICRAYTEEERVDCRVFRLHNVYGAHGSWNDGREKAPAALSRKVAQAKANGGQQSIDVWGDGSRARSYMHIDDCLEGIERLMASDVREPLNLGQADWVTVNQLIETIEGIAGVTVDRRYDLTQAQGVQGRTSDNTKIEQLLGWSPGISLQEGLEKTYPWIEEQVLKEQNNGTP